MKDCEAGTALCGVRVEIEKWGWPLGRGACPPVSEVQKNGIGVVGLRFKCCPLPLDPNASK